MKHSYRLVIGVLVLGCLGLGLGRPATATELGWKLRVNGFWVDPGGNLDFDGPEGTRVRSDSDSGGGGGINGEYRFSPRLGLEVGALGGAESDVTIRAGGPESFFASDTLAFGATCAGLNVHLSPDSKADVYAGPVLAYMNFSNISVGTGRFFDGFPFVGSNSVVVSVDDDFAYGANLGVDVPIGEGSWFFNANLRYLDATVDATGPDGERRSISYDPLFVGLGFGYEF